MFRIISKIQPTLLWPIIYVPIPHILWKPNHNFSSYSANRQTNNDGSKHYPCRPVVEVVSSQYSLFRGDFVENLLLAIFTDLFLITGSHIDTTFLRLDVSNQHLLACVQLRYQVIHLRDHPRHLTRQPPGRFRLDEVGQCTATGLHYVSYILQILHRQQW